MLLRWTPAAAADLQSINIYLKENHPQYHQATVRRLYDMIQSLKQFPMRGRPGREAGTRELPFTPLPYIAVYRVKGENIEVLRIYHGARQLP